LRTQQVGVYEVAMTLSMCEKCYNLHLSQLRAQSCMTYDLNPELFEMKKVSKPSLVTSKAIETTCVWSYQVVA
jgi:hypothetical protein